MFGLRHGAYDYLPKPFSIREIQELLARIRTDRRRWDGQVPLPAGLTEELSRRQAGVEVMFRIGDLALKGLQWRFDEEISVIPPTEQAPAASKAKAPLAAKKTARPGGAK